LVARISAAVRVKTLQDELRQRNAELDAMSHTDILTSLPNRRHLHERLIAECALARRHGRPLSLLLIDVDHFKDVNDTWGHAAGDLVLQAVGARIAHASRAEDLPGRWGGEEFVVIVPATDLAGAAVLGEHLRAVVAAEPISIGDGSITVTVSVGVACGGGTDELMIEGDDEGALAGGEALLRAADAALYIAKDAGRNLVATSAGTTPTGG
jgi:two-component system, cell cycle response regulator